MIEGGGNASVPKLFLSGDFFDVSMYGVGRWHYECSEVCWLEDNDVIVVVHSLVVVVMSGKQVGFLVEDTGFVA